MWIKHENIEVYCEHFIIFHYKEILNRSKYIYFQGASATYPNFFCDVKLSDLRSHGDSAHEHNFNTIVCQGRNFDHMRSKLGDQIHSLSKGREHTMREYEDSFNIAKVINTIWGSAGLTKIWKPD